MNSYFADDVWSKVGATKCLGCHKVGGDAEDSQFVLRDPERGQEAERPQILRHNRETFTRVARMQEKDHRSRMLLKVTGGLDHGGDDVLKADSTG